MMILFRNRILLENLIFFVRENPYFFVRKNLIFFVLKKSFFRILICLLQIQIQGGPMVKKSDGSLIGILSFAHGTTDPPVIEVQVYTRVHAYYDWIKEMTGISTPVC